MNNNPVAYMQTWQNQDGELKKTVNIEQIGKQDIPLYTAEQIIKKNKPEIEKANAYIKSLEDEIEALKKQFDSMAKTLNAFGVKELKYEK